jgi:hypothetical protein
VLRAAGPQHPQAHSLPQFVQYAILSKNET